LVEKYRSEVVFGEPPPRLKTSASLVERWNGARLAVGHTSRLLRTQVDWQVDAKATETDSDHFSFLQTDVCYLQNGQYVDSVEQINIVGTGAEAVQGPCKVQWAADASTAGGAVQLTSTSWTNVTNVAYLTNGIHVMKLHCLTDATGCDFNMWGGSNINFGNVGIFGSGDNIVVISNTFNGNMSLEPTSFADVSTNSYYSTDIAASGFVYIQWSGNIFVARNSIF
jgi:hypothetical protein